MRLSMWMIANRLSMFNPEISIAREAPVCLKSGRRFYATDCVYVFQRSSDVVCMNEDSYLIIKDMDVEEAFEIIQSVFDFYDDWYAAVSEAARTKDYQRIVDISWHIFHNPMILLDANNNVLAFSKNYETIPVDGEWKHLMKYGCSSINAIRYLRDEANRYDFHSMVPRVYRFGKKGFSDCLSSMIYDNAQCGRINILEREREINQGDIQNLKILVNLLAPYMGKEGDSEKKDYYSVFYDLIQGKEVAEEELCTQLGYWNWRETDTYGIWLIHHETDVMQGQIQQLTAHLISQLIPQCEVFSLHDCVAIIYNQEKMSTDRLTKILDPLLVYNRLIAGISLPIPCLRNLQYFYKQAQFALRRKELKKRYYKFYEFAIDYIIVSGNKYEIMQACHPDVRSLYQKDQAQEGDRIKTLQAYLNNERSLVNTAHELYVHRNTLVYRVKKLVEEIHSDMNNGYTRDYMKISIRILSLF